MGKQQEDEREGRKLETNAEKSEEKRSKVKTAALWET